MSDLKEDTKIIDKLGYGMLLAFVGGFMDLYSYIVRGNVFATGQTGNFVLVAVHLVQRNYIETLHAIIPIVSFLLGIFIAWHLFYSHFKEERISWERGILAIEIFILFITGFVPCSYPNIIANTFVSFAASFQYCAFRKFSTNEDYASIFCTGNMRSCAENLYNGFLKKDKQCLKKALRYSYILISFFAGAIIGSFESVILHEKAIWSVSAVLLVVLLSSFLSNTAIFKNAIQFKGSMKEHF
ncbi:DUF1275 domain-containing protein [Clostridium sp. PL3]|uniref:DUF1275 domain-containing protein n=1 Tax=Clostridium thailandense TaxID=2794346 RepID=A0A949WSJ6_9CLOT|nr:YoaK family protein [Clostridium thailandense]MBV7275151.1 DUF1275 domain-containing protein [Clostridium thailandense]